MKSSRRMAPPLVVSPASQLECRHPLTKLRRRTIQGGAIQYVDQCQRCGKAVNQPVAHGAVIALSGGIEPPDFDDDLRANWERAKEADLQQRKKDVAGQLDARKAAFDAWYTEYLKSPEWRVKREQVMKRARYICEGCGDQRATTVHHLTYAHVGCEFLFELVALCCDCHARAHNRR